MATEINSDSLRGQLSRLDNLVEYLETQDVIAEDNPAFKDMCEFYMELEQVVTNLHTIIG